jgi:hypothetical protein
MKLQTMIVGLALGCLATSPLAAMADDGEYKKSAGYIDFGDLKQYSDGDESIEVFLAPPLLGLIEAIIAREEPELAAMIEELLLVKVDVFSFDAGDTQKLESLADRVAGDLGGRGWQRLVKVQQRDERVLLYVLPTTRDEGERQRQLISGVVVVVLGGDELNLEIGNRDDDVSERQRRDDEANEAVFVNIVGTFDLDAIAELIERFDVPRVGSHLRDWERDDFDDTDADAPKADRDGR